MQFHPSDFCLLPDEGMVFGQVWFDGQDDWVLCVWDAHKLPVGHGGVEDFLQNRICRVKPCLVRKVLSDGVVVLVWTEKEVFHGFFRFRTAGALRRGS